MKTVAPHSAKRQWVHFYTCYLIETAVTKGEVIRDARVKRGTVMRGEGKVTSVTHAGRGPEWEPVHGGPWGQVSALVPS